MGEFFDNVFQIVKQIPAGKVLSYGDIARRIGAPRKARFVGYALHDNPEPWTGTTGNPCHRVVFKDGGMATGYAFGGPEVQRKLLEDEGVIFLDDDHVDMERCRWTGDSRLTGDHEAARWNDHAEDDDRRSRKDRDREEGRFPTAPPVDFDWEAELGEAGSD